MWFFIAFIAVLAFLVLHLNHRGASGAGDHFHSTKHEAGYLPFVSAKYSEVKKKS